jgi:hypothetical protein
MKIINYAVAISLTGCGNPGGDSASMALPTEVVSCVHPDSRFEAAVYVEVEDEELWDSVHFEIAQDERIWKTRLQTDDSLYWWTRMQLIELDCFSEFEYKVSYEAR